MEGSELAEGQAGDGHSREGRRNKGDLSVSAASGGAKVEGAMERPQGRVGRPRPLGLTREPPLDDLARSSLVDLSDTPLVAEWGPPWIGLAADDSPIVLCDRGTRDLDAFDFEAP